MTCKCQKEIQSLKEELAILKSMDVVKPMLTLHKFIRNYNAEVNSYLPENYTNLDLDRALNKYIANNITSLDCKLDIDDAAICIRHLFLYVFLAIKWINSDDTVEFLYEKNTIIFPEFEKHKDYVLKLAEEIMRQLQ
jgi:hypothetical protein